jgi:hypothetical protein
VRLNYPGDLRGRQPFAVGPSILKGLGGFGYYFVSQDITYNPETNKSTVTFQKVAQ